LLTRLYQTLIRLKRTNPALEAGNTKAVTYRIKTTADDKVFCYLRKNGEHEVLVVLNLSAQNDLHFEFKDPQVKGRFANVFSGAANDFNATTPFEMQAWEYLVYEK